MPQASFNQTIILVIDLVIGVELCDVAFELGFFLYFPSARQALGPKWCVGVWQDHCDFCGPYRPYFTGEMPFRQMLLWLLCGTGWIFSDVCPLGNGVAIKNCPQCRGVVCIGEGVDHLFSGWRKKKSPRSNVTHWDYIACTIFVLRMWEKLAQLSKQGSEGDRASSVMQQMLNFIFLFCPNGTFSLLSYFSVFVCRSTCHYTDC